MINIVDKKNCCGCMACKAACKLSAISITEDQYGNVFPVVDEATCVKCEQCLKVCPMIGQNAFHNTKEAYAVKLNDNNVLMKSASGGAFYGLAISFIKFMDGIVVGCAYNSELLPELKIATSEKDITKFQGSKYVMSTIDYSLYNSVRENLKNNINVLFFGVPCQCAAIKQFCNDCLSNLYTVDIICHGFVNQSFWKDYISIIEKEKKGKVVDFTFRGKNKSNFLGTYSIKKNNFSKEYIKQYPVNPAISYYYDEFLSGHIYRENCYKCIFAQRNRLGDITIGDYWGYDGSLGKEGYVSCFLVNSSKGTELLNLVRDKFLSAEVANIDEIASNNGQLNYPSPVSKKNYLVLDLWRNKGAEYLNREHHKKHIKAYLASKLGVYR